jgi:CheY-like chemotaxis protein
VDLATASVALAFAASTTWLAGGIGLLLHGDGRHARPAFLGALGLLLGGLLLGADAAAWGGYPLAAILLAAAFAWALQGDDEANGLQPGDRWLPALILAALAFVLHALGSMLGAQPLLMAGIALRPFDLPVAAGLYFLWYRARARPEREPFDLGARPTRELLWITAGATLAGFFGGELGECVRHALLAAAPLPLLLRLQRVAPTEIARIAAVATTGTLLFALLIGMQQVRTDQRRQIEVIDASCALDIHYARMQTAIDTALQTATFEEPKLLYDRHHENMLRALEHLSGAVLRIGDDELTLALHALESVTATHHRWCRTALEALSVRAAAWGDTDARDRADARARSAHEESRLAWQRGLLALQSLRRAVGTGLQRIADGVDQARSTAAALLAALALLAGALLVRTSRSSPALPSRRRRGRVLVVDESAARRSVVLEIVAATDAELELVDNGAAALALLERERFDLVLLDMLVAGIDAFATARWLQNERGPLPVVALSGERARALESGCVAHLANPIHPDALREVLRQHLPQPT